MALLAFQCVQARRANSPMVKEHDRPQRGQLCNSKARSPKRVAMEPLGIPMDIPQDKQIVDISIPQRLFTLCLPSHMSICPDSSQWHKINPTRDCFFSETLHTSDPVEEYTCNCAYDTKTLNCLQPRRVERCSSLVQTPSKKSRTPRFQS